MPRRITLFGLAAFAIAQEPTVFRAGVSLVHVDAEVISAEGRVLTGLSKNDFRVFDDGKEQSVLTFSADEQPLDLILLFDISGSMRLVVQRVADAARQGLTELRRGDRVSVMVFNSRTRVLSPFTEDLESVERTVRQDLLALRFGKGTLIQQAVDDAARRFLREPRSARRRAVLIITDNIGMRTRREEPIVRDFWEADTLLSGLIIQNQAFQKTQSFATVLAPQMLLMRAGMKGIAERTGGDAIRSDEAGPAFQEMMHRIRSRYSLYYAMPPGKPGTSRVIHIELTAETQQHFRKAQVRARHGYRIPEATASESQQ